MRSLLQPLTPTWSANLSFPLGSAWLMALGLMFSSLSVHAAASDLFQKKVEPILVKRCSECHGADQQKAKLRLDSASEALKAGKSGKLAIVPGNPEHSEIIRRVTSPDPDEVMPPKGDRLSADDVAALRDWIQAGAVWPAWDPSSHWSFRPLQRPPTPAPAPSDSQWIRNDIDAFILAKLREHQLRPSPEADRRTIARRLALDLTGLPPSPEAVEAFVANPAPNAYEALVDELLNSRHYGEHIARWWLDLARYADSNGYQVDLARSNWPYRDWVINAFNQNLPFDQFTIEQLAGDLLPGATLEQRIATGFNRNTKINDEGGGDAEEYRTKAVKDRVATTGTTWLGLTVMCAECHTHKYDPISQDEYYRLYAFFNSTTDGGNYSVEPTVAVPPPPTGTLVGYLRDRQKSTQQEIARASASLATEQSQWETQAKATGPIWTPLNLVNPISTGGSSYTNLPDQSLLAVGVNPIYDTILVEAETAATEVTAVLLEVLPDPSLPKNGPGRWGASGNFILDEFTISAGPKGNTNEALKPVSIRSATADWEQLYYRAEHAVDRNPRTGWAIGPRFGEPHFLIVEFKEPLRFPDGARLGFKFDHYHGSSHTIGRMRISVTAQQSPELRWPLPAEIAAQLNIPASERPPAEAARVKAHYAKVSTRMRQLNRALYDLNQKETELANTRFTSLVMQERSEPRSTHVHLRGNFLEKGNSVGPGVPAFLPPLDTNQPLNRLALARWLVNPTNPLPARVTVNRLWERFFGTGLAKTSEDVGRQGEAPSHPELLDWLAAEFIASGWDLKHLQRTLVLSATYRQSAAADAERLEKDFYNRLISRGPRFRLDGESIRDVALSVSGLLNYETGGPSVYPVQIPNLWKEIGFLRPEIGMDEWPLSVGPNLYRRGVYTFWRRVCTYPAFSTFDAPSRDVCVSRRPRTNTPLQALAGLNETVLVESARALAQRLMAHGTGDPAERVRLGFQLCVSRPPTAAETRRLVDFFEQQRSGFAQDLAAAQALLSVGNAQRPSGLDTAQLAAWTMVANVLLNLDETLTKG
jgi:cytochrome c553